MAKARHVAGAPAASSGVGSYAYVKRLPEGREQTARLDVYGLQVSSEHLGFPEMHERTPVWVSPAKAAELVDEPEPKALIAAFCPARLAGVPAPRLRDSRT
jgi:hypothetical protein